MREDETISGGLRGLIKHIADQRNKLQEELKTQETELRDEMYALEQERDAIMEIAQQFDLIVRGIESCHTIQFQRTARRLSKDLEKLMTVEVKPAEGEDG
jgi:septal ring factor EnvC (AmiA/AmiB activator)